MILLFRVMLVFISFMILASFSVSAVALALMPLGQLPESLPRVRVCESLFFHCTIGENNINQGQSVPEIVRQKS